MRHITTTDFSRDDLFDTMVREIESLIMLDKRLSHAGKEKMLALILQMSEQRGWELKAQPKEQSVTTP